MQRYRYLGSNIGKGEKKEDNQHKLDLLEIFAPLEDQVKNRLWWRNHICVNTRILKSDLVAQNQFA